jgi:hypothetical protein
MSGFMSRADIANFFATQSGLISALIPCVIRAGSGNRTAWGSFLRPGGGSATSQVTPFRCLVSFRDIESTKAGKDLLLDLSCFEEWSSPMIALGRLDLSVILMARFTAIEESGDEGRFIIRMEALGAPPISYNFGSQNMYGVTPSTDLEPCPAGGINDLIERPGLKTIQQLQRLHRSLMPSGIPWVDFLWIFVLATPLICGISIGGRSVLSEGGRPMSWLAKLMDGSSWIASYWLTVGPAIKKALIDTRLIEALDGKVAQAILCITENIDVLDGLCDHQVIAALTPGRGSCEKITIQRLVDVADTQPPLDISVAILQVFLYHAASLEAAIPGGDHANRLTDIGFPAASDLGVRGFDGPLLSERLSAYPEHITSGLWGSEAIMRSLISPARPIGGPVPVTMKGGVGVIVPAVSATSSSNSTSTWSPTSLSASQQRDQQDQQAALHAATIAVHHA